MNYKHAGVVLWYVQSQTFGVRILCLSSAATVLPHRLPVIFFSCNSSGAWAPHGSLGPSWAFSRLLDQCWSNLAPHLHQTNISGCLLLEVSNRACAALNTTNSSSSVPCLMWILRVKGFFPTKCVLLFSALSKCQFYHNDSWNYTHLYVLSVLSFRGWMIEPKEAGNTSALTQTLLNQVSDPHPRSLNGSELSFLLEPLSLSGRVQKNL